MFRCVEHSLEPDPVFEADLKKLGLFLNNVGQIRMIAAPDKPYNFRSTNNERVNEVLREAVQKCQRVETEKRLSALGLTQIYLPDFNTTKPYGPHVSVLAPVPMILKTRKRIIVLINDAQQDLGILSYGQLQHDLGVNGGSVVNFMKEIIRRSATEYGEKYANIFADGQSVQNDSDVPALMVMNTGQLIYSHKYNQSMTMRSWSALPRKSMVHDMIRIHEKENRVKGHRNPKEHIKSVFTEMICNTDRVAVDAEVYVIAIEDGANNLLDVLTEDFEKYGTRITGMALIHSLSDASQIKNANFREFLHRRARQWKCSERTSDPLHCTDLPKDFYEIFKNKPQPKVFTPTKRVQHISWNDTSSCTVPGGSVIPGNVLNPLCWSDTSSWDSAGDSASARDHILPDMSSLEKTSAPRAFVASTEWSDGLDVVCPTYAGGDSFVGERVFTNPTIQHAILSFFEDIARDPAAYSNSESELYMAAPQPTPDNPLMLFDESSVKESDRISPEMMPEQAELYEARQMLGNMRMALDACPSNVKELEEGRDRLAKKIRDKEREIETLSRKILYNGGFQAGEAQEMRENWKPQKEGRKVAFAGTVVDSELLKAAGMFDTANEELEDLGSEEEKASN